ncbi:MAG: benzoate/H(+) symporter BenE family transporter [Alphaproteobacteria bacterium]|nr:benzoate/H(+) symporter BenE family transporter [Alphaproteobacteria bacterium]
MPQAIGAGLLVALVGYASSVAVVIQGLSAVGASSAEIASALVALGLAKGLLAIGLSLRYRLPISIAWTTPGAALLVSTGMVQGGFAAAVGAFMAVGFLVILAAFWRPLGRLIGAIPTPIASAMLAGILLKLCLAPFLALAEMPLLALPVLLVWLLVGRFARLLAVPVALLLALALIAASSPDLELAGAGLWPGLAFVPPAWSWEAMIGIALPLFIVTMASQNVTGFAVLSTFGYRPPVTPVLAATGLASVLAAPFGAITVNLAAITAALCAGPEAGSDPARRYLAAVIGGIGYIALAGLAGIAAGLVAVAPPTLIEAVAGLALMAAFGQAASNAFAGEAERLPALVTFLVTASGLAFFGIGAAFWGLVFGLVVRLVYRAAGPGLSRR